MIDSISKVNGTPGIGLSTSPALETNNEGSVGSFDEMLKSVASKTVKTLYMAETTAISGISDKASIQQVVDQVMAAERTLQTTIAVRDKVVSAYQEISRMAI